MAVAGMRELCRAADGILMIFVAVELTIEVRRPDSMESSPMGVPGLSVMMIDIGMNMEQRRCEHPQRRPDQDSHARPVRLFALQLH